MLVPRLPPRAINPSVISRMRSRWSDTASDSIKRSFGKQTFVWELADLQAAGWLSGLALRLAAPRAPSDADPANSWQRYGHRVTVGLPTCHEPTCPRATSRRAACQPLAAFRSG